MVVCFHKAALVFGAVVCFGPPQEKAMTRCELIFARCADFRTLLKRLLRIAV